MNFLSTAAMLLTIGIAFLCIEQVNSAVSSASLNRAASSFSLNLGRSSGLNQAVSQEFADSCLRQCSRPTHRPPYRPTFYPPIHPLRPTFSPFRHPQPRLHNTAHRAVRSVSSQLYNRDFVFVLDSSGSIPSDQFETAKRAIATLVEYLCPPTFGHHVTTEGTKQISVVTFSNGAKTEIDFSESSSGLTYLKNKILNIKHQRGSTATGPALRHVRTQVLGKGSSRLYDTRVSTDVIVITDGRCNVDCCILRSEANAIRELGHGVNLFALAVGNARDCELEIITGQGTKLDHNLHDFTTFERFVEEFKKIAQARPNKCA